MKQAINESNAKYKEQADRHRRRLVFEVGDLVWVVLTRDRFPARDYNKLKERKIGPCEVLQKINDNAYRLRLLSHLRTSDVFNVNHLSPYVEEFDDEVVNSRTRSFQLGETDAELSDAELSDCALMALNYLKKEDQCKNGKNPTI